MDTEKVNQLADNVKQLIALHKEREEMAAVQAYMAADAMMAARKD